MRYFGEDPTCVRDDRGCGNAPPLARFGRLVSQNDRSRPLISADRRGEMPPVVASHGGRIGFVKTRRVGVADWAVVRDLRLRALADAPEAFGSSYEREVLFSDDVWIGRVGTLTNATFVCEVGGEACGMVTVVRDTTDSRLGWLVGMWVAPSARGTGAADWLVVSALEWADHQGIGSVRLRVADGNARAERLYHRHAFRRTGETIQGERPGLVEVVMQRTTWPQPGEAHR
jgi:GNAT superfamily N-acetyltransferase